MMQTDVKTKTVTVSGPGTFAGIGPCRIKAIRFTGTNAGYLTIVINPTTSVKYLIKDMLFLQAGSEYLLFPGEGIRAEADPFIFGNNLASVVVFYG